MKQEFCTRAGRFALLVSLFAGAAPCSSLVDRAHAQDLRRIEIEDVPACRAHAGFVAEVDELVGTDAQRAITIRVRLSRARRAVRVQMHVLDAGRTAHRTLTLPSCAEANDAAVLFAALAIDPELKRAGDATAAPTRDGANDPVAVANSASEPIPQAATSSSADPVASPAPQPAARRLGAWPALFVRANAGLDPRLLHRPSGLAALELGLQVRGLEYALGGRYAPLQAIGARGAANEALEASVGSVTLRAGAPLHRGAFVLVPSAGLLLTALRAQARGFDTDPVRRAFVPEVQVGLLGAWRANARLWIELGADVRLLLRRPELATDGVVRYRLPIVAGQLSVGLRFWAVAPTRGS